MRSAFSSDASFGLLAMITASYFSNRAFSCPTVVPFLSITIAVLTDTANPGTSRSVATKSAASGTCGNLGRNWAASPAGFSGNCAKARDAPSIVAPSKLARARVAPARFAPVSRALCRFASAKFALARSACDRSALRRSAPDKSVPDRSAPERTKRCSTRIKRRAMSNGIGIECPTVAVASAPPGTTGSRICQLMRSELV
jgi:hypothetical protein